MPRKLGDNQVFNAQAANASSAGIKCWHCSSNITSSRAKKEIADLWALEPMLQSYSIYKVDMVCVKDKTTKTVMPFTNAFNDDNLIQCVYGKRR